MARVDIKLSKENFDKDRDSRLEARIANFPLEKGDTIRFLEYDRKTDTLTGRYFDKKVVDFHKIHKAMKYFAKKDLLKYGLYIFELTDNSEE